MIPKKEVEYEYKSHSNITVSNLDEKIDLGVTVIGIFAGLNFWKENQMMMIFTQLWTREI